MKNSIKLSCLLLVVLISSCKKDMAPVAECVEEVSYSAKIQPVIELNCSTSGCHDAAAQGGVNLVSYIGVSANADKILNVIQLEEGNVDLMPLGGPRLADSTIEQFNCWIQQGKLNN